MRNVQERQLNVLVHYENMRMCGTDPQGTEVLTSSASCLLRLLKRLTPC
jgi:hypothetical protein